MPLFPDHFYDPSGVFITELRGLGLDHHADDRLGPALADHDPPGVPEGGGDLRDGADFIESGMSPEFIIPSSGKQFFPSCRVIAAIQFFRVVTGTTRTPS